MAAASELLANHANRVILTGVNRDEGKEAVEKLTNQFGKQKAMFLLGDVSNIYEFERIFKQVISECQKIDILFNNAEIADDEQWEKEIDINIQGVLCGTLLAFKYMGKRSGANGGVVINNASIVGFEALPHAPIYSASKHAVVSLTRNMGAQYHYNQTGLRVVALCPGVKQSVYTSSLYGRRLMKQKKESMKKFSNLHFMESSPGTIGRAVVHLIRSAPSGTLWSLENTVLSQIHIPPSKQYLKLVKNFNKLK
ncbi:15-hydroxyprostaglandin dehydrogenase [NAD(+)]-like [Periplaneta americana]|uniref:15-hydroxyprostaglandin dehydrogenase [NAD(+)]-like n=1 Tax=Periplaneta americana TaxID=6978 RepID=UPI0037E99EDC